MSGHVSLKILYASILVSIVVGFYGALAANEIALFTFLIALVASEALIIYFLAGRNKKFIEQVKYLDELIAKVNNGQTLGSLQQLLHDAPR